MSPSDHTLTSIEICAGAGGQASGLHDAGFRHLALVEIDKHACETLRLNVAKRKTEWGDKDKIVVEMDVKNYANSQEFAALGFGSNGLDLLAGGVPCPPFSHAGKQLGEDDERDLFPAMLALVEKLNPRAVLIENVRGIMDPKFQYYRDSIESKLGGRSDQPTLDGLGYRVCGWRVIEASKFGVPQLRPRAILVAIRRDVLAEVEFTWPEPTHLNPVSVAEALKDTMRERYEEFGAQGIKRFDEWLDEAEEQADKVGGNGGIAPTLVGGSKKHGGADLGPSRAKAAWDKLGISGMGVANAKEICREKVSEDRDLFGPGGPMLTVKQAAIIQGFPPDWVFSGGKTAQYRQVGNAFPPPVAKAVGKAIADVLRAADKRDLKKETEPVEVLSEQLLLALPNGADNRQRAGV